MTTPDSDPPRRKRIAVIAVHGVADQKPDETANTAANLLLDMDNDGKPSPYRGFKTHRLRIAFRKVHLANRAPPMGSHDSSEKCQHQFLRGQLKQYREPGPAATYETIRNEGIRRDPSTGEEREVHIYEAYWADLSRLGNSFLTFFVELYQLLFHLCTVGAKTARFARERHHEIRTWRAFYYAIYRASHLIRLIIPIANLFVIAIIVLGASDQIPPDAAPVRVIVTAFIPLALGVILAFYLRSRVRPLGWPYVLIAIVAVVTGLSAFASYYLSTSGRLDIAMAVEIWALLLFALRAILKAYERRHPDALIWGLVFGLAATALLWVNGVVHGGGLYKVCKESAIQLLIVVGSSWFFAVIFAASACIAGWLALSKIKGEDKAGARRAIFTANLTTSLTGMVMLIINIALWGLIPTLLQKVIPAAPATPATPDHFNVIRTLASEMREHLETVTILPGMMTLIVLIAVAAVWMIWSLIPAVRSEITTPAAEPESSRWIGLSLTNAFRVMTWAGYLAIASFTGLLALFSTFSVIRQIADRLHIVPTWLKTIPFLDTIDKPNAIALFGGFSGFILLFIVAPFFMKGFVVKLSAGFRQGLDVALDVINYLREHPEDQTIRAQIFTRFVSLLRYVCNWKSPIDGAGYDRIIVFAHSQGTMITVDLLRFLQVERDPELTYLDQPDRIRLFTMGCPLRQLYGLRFPHIYDWARHSGEPRATDALPDDRVPDPDRLLSVGKWVNAYRSGDYVGRNLWRSEGDDDVYKLYPESISEDSTKKRREFCIGGGAHTHYWDKTAYPIVAELDRLIASA